MPQKNTNACIFWIFYYVLSSKNLIKPLYIILLQAIKIWIFFEET